MRGKWELFDLAADRTEQNDLAAEHPEEVASLRDQWRVWAKDNNVLPKPARQGGKKKSKSKSKSKSKAK